MPDTIISQVNALLQGQPNDIEFLDQKKHTIGEIEITEVDARETDAPH